MRGIELTIATIATFGMLFIINLVTWLNLPKNMPGMDSPSEKNYLIAWITMLVVWTVMLVACQKFFKGDTKYSSEVKVGWGIAIWLGLVIWVSLLVGWVYLKRVREHPDELDKHRGGFLIAWIVSLVLTVGLPLLFAFRPIRLLMGLSF